MSKILLQPSRPTTATSSTPPFLSYSTTSNFSGNPFSPSPSSSSSPLLPQQQPITSGPPLQISSTFSKFSHLNSKESNLKADVRIKVRDGQSSKYISFYCHKQVLGLASPFFEALLNGGWRETRVVSSGKGKEREEKQEGEIDLGGGGRENEGVDSVPIVTLSLDGELDQLDLLDLTSTSNLPTSTSDIGEQKELSNSVEIDSISMTNSYMSSFLEDEDEEDEEDSDEESGIICRLKLKEENAASFHDLLSHIYPRLEVLISWNNVGDLCKMANKFDLPSLRNVCVAFLLPSAAGNPIKGMQIAEENMIPELYKESSRYLLDSYTTWSTLDCSVLSPSTLLKLERRRSWYLERVLKLSQIQIAREYFCCATCPDPSLCAKSVEDKWRSAWNSTFRFGTPQPSILYRSLRSLEPSLASPALHLGHTSCQAHAKLWLADLFDRMFLLGIVPSRNWGAMTLNGTSSAGGYGRTFAPNFQDTVAKNGGAKYFMYVEMD